MSRGGRRKTKTAAAARARVAELEARPVLADEDAVAGVLWACAQAQHELRARAQDALEGAYRQGHLSPGGMFAPASGTTT
jgi:hypothetical protein